MAITLNKLTFDIKNIASSGVQSDNFRISDRQVEYWIHQCRANLIYQDMLKRKDITDAFIQEINCIDLQLVDQSECCNNEIGCYELESIEDIPQTIDVTGDNMIISVNTMDGTLIHKSNSSRKKYSSYSKYTSSVRRWYIRNKKLRIINDTFLDKVSLRGIFDDPSEVGKFYNCDGDLCWTTDSQYPVTMKMANTITDIILKTKIYPLLSLPQDKSNDAEDSPDPIRVSK